MVNISTLASAIAAASVINSAVAHPGEHHSKRELTNHIMERQAAAAAAGKRALAACESSAERLALESRNIARRAQAAKDLRAKRGITTPAKKFRRDDASLATYEAVDHNKTGIYDYTSSTDAETIFSANTSCILTPEITDGPYYVLGESIRKNVKEDLYSDGVDLYLEVQYLDVETCEPVENLYVDIWNANATGIYSGISVSGNYAADGWNSTYLRGVQATDSEGVVSFETIFPGHYEGRATHTHLLVHSNVTVLPNNTMLGGAVTHIGQVFWNTALRDAVEAVYPYTTNTQAVTTNEEDMWAPLQADNDYDPFPEFIYLGSDITDGLLAWIQVGINTTQDMTDDDYYSTAALHDANGGHCIDECSAGGDGGAPSGNGSVPTGFASGIASGVVPTAVPSGI